MRHHKGVRIDPAIPGGMGDLVWSFEQIAADHLPPVKN
jgi:hypothetical protein